MAFLIWKDENGVEQRKTKGRGRTPRYFEQAEDGNWYYNPAAEAADVKPVVVKAPKQPKQKVYLITLDAEGNETEKIEKRRGRIPNKYIQRPDGHWYCSPDFMKPASSTSSEVEAEAKEDVEDIAKPDRIPKLIRIHARKKTTIKQIIQACRVLHQEQHNGTTILDKPVRYGQTGIPEIDQIPGHPIFHKIEINETDKTVAIWGIASPGGPYLIIEDAVEINGEKDAATPETSRL